MQFSLILFLLVLQTEATPSSLHEVTDFKAILTWYNRSLADNVVFKVGKINRTTFALNASYDLLKDIDPKEIIFRVDVYKLYRTEYKNTGIKIATNACKMFQSNVFGIKDLIISYGNIDPCKPLKGHYYLRNMVPSVDAIKVVLYGNFKADVALYLEHSGDLFKIQFFVVLEPKDKTKFWN